ncbi:MAG: HAMP domain-containing sensor histidine kinase, partial [Myxococcota bacterium]
MIRNTLIFAYLAPMVILLVVGGLLIYVKAETLLEQELGQRLISVAEATTGGLPNGDPRRLAQLTAEDTATIGRMREKLEAIRQVTGVRRIFILDPQLRSLVDTREGIRFHDKLFEIQADRVELERVFTAPGVSVSSVMYSGKDGVFYKNGYAPIVYEAQVVAAIGVEGSAEFFDNLTDFQVGLAAVLLVGLLMIVLVSVLVARTIIQPIDHLVVEARRLGRGDLSSEVRLDRGDEFQMLAAAFDEMRRDLLDRDEQMQMMLSGIAHEVRNPLGGMELFCGLLAEDLEPGSQEYTYIGKVQTELEYLKRVVQDFLEFARRGRLELERLDAQAVLMEVTGLLMWDLEGEGVRLVQGEMEAGLELTADKERLRRVLINLIRNAGQASRSGSTVTVWCRQLADPMDLAELESFEVQQRI